MAWGINASGRVVGTKGQSQSRAVLYTDAAGLLHQHRAVAPALVVGRWTLPEGSNYDDDVWTSSSGVAAFTMQGKGGV